MCFFFELGMSGGPCYVVNENGVTNQIIGVICAKTKVMGKPNWGTLFTHKTQELINFSELFLPKKKGEEQKEKQKKIRII